MSPERNPELQVAMGEIGLVHVYIGSVEGARRCPREGLLCPACLNELEERALRLEAGTVTVTGHKRHDRNDCLGAWVHNRKLLRNPVPLPCKDINCNTAWEGLDV